MHCKSTLTKQTGQEKPPQRVQEMGSILTQAPGAPQGNDWQWTEPAVLCSFSREGVIETVFWFSLNLYNSKEGEIPDTVST